MKIKEYNQMMSYLTRPDTKTVVKNNKSEKKQTELELEQFKAPVKKDVFEKMGESLIDNLIKYEDLDPKEQIVKYDSATGLFSNNKKDIGFKDVGSARKHNEVYEKYIPEIQSLKKAVEVTPRVKPKVKPIVKPVATPIPQFNMNFKPYQRDPKDVLAETNFNKILDDVRKQKALEETQGLPGLIPNSSKIIERSESRMKQLKPKTYGGDDDL